MKEKPKNGEYKYIYCIINKRVKNNFGDIGIENNEVYTLPYREFSIIVNDCSVKEINSKKKIDLAIEHQYVVDAMMKKFDALIPLNAGILIKEEKIKNWIDKNHQKLITIFEKIKNKQEFGIQIFYNAKIKYTKIKDFRCPENSKNFQGQQELTGKVKDYIDKQKKSRKELMLSLVKYKEDLYNQINKIVDEVKNMEMSISSSDKQIILNLTCLVDKNKIGNLKSYLKKINSMKDFSVNFNGPWAPYSFID